MENSLALCLLLLTILSCRHHRNSGKLDWLTPVTLALASLTRPEMVLLAGLVGLDLLLRERKRLVPNLATLVLLYAAIVTPWLVYAQTTFGTIVPNTITAKLSRDHVSALTGTLKYFLSFWPLQAAAVLSLPFVFKGFSNRDWLSRDALQWLVPAGWGLVLPIFYVVGGAPVSGRYLMYATPIYLLVGMLAFAHLWEKGMRRVVALAVLGTLGLLAVVQYKYCWFVTRWSQGMDPRFIALAKAAKAAGKPGDIVACDQIGVMGYFSDLYVLDIIGLVSPEVLAQRKAADPNRIWRYVRERGADFLFVIDDTDLLVSRDPGYASLELIKQSAVTREGAGAVGRDAVYYLYRTHWSN